MQHEQYPEIPDDFGHWLAGFADGEGCFQIGGTHGGRWACSFLIGLRRDDKPILAEIRDRTGLGRVADKTPHGTSNPQCRWEVERKRDTQRLVEVFDRFPLRAKKQRDYLVWREAVAYWSSLGVGHRFSTHRGSLPHNWGPMPALAAELRAVRRYAAPPAEPRPTAPPISASAIPLFTISGGAVSLRDELLE